MMRPFPTKATRRARGSSRRWCRSRPATPRSPENRAAWEVLERFDRPVLTAFAENDAVTRGGEKIFIERVPGARDQLHVIVKDAGHFLQEDKPGALCALIDSFARQQPKGIAA